MERGFFRPSTVIISLGSWLCQCCPKVLCLGREAGQRPGQQGGAGVGPELLASLEGSCSWGCSMGAPPRPPAHGASPGAQGPACSPRPASTLTLAVRKSGHRRHLLLQTGRKDSPVPWPLGPLGHVCSVFAKCHLLSLERETWGVGTASQPWPPSWGRERCAEGPSPAARSPWLPRSRGTC